MFTPNNLKIGLAHDSLIQQGGAERVLDVLHELYPEAPVYTLVFDHRLKQKYAGWKIETSQLQVPYLSISNLQYLLPMIPLAVDNLNFRLFDVVLSSSSSFIKNIRVPKNTVHICYCHTPTRFLWSDLQYVKQEVPMFLRPLARWYLKRMKKWDYAGAQRVTHFIANSNEVQKRIKEYYGRESVVIPPPIDTTFWKKTKEKENYFLLAGRLQAHKRNDLIIEVFNQVGLPLRVVGTGRQEEYLKKIAKPNITFFGRVSDEELRNQYSGALALVYPQIEDAGLMPLEAAACGTATIAVAAGGSLETVIPGATGELFQNDNSHEILKMIRAWQPSKYLAHVLRAHAEKFNKEIFKQKISEFVTTHINVK